MVGKKGWLRIIEASIAILIVAAAVLVIANKRQTISESDLSAVITPLLEEMSENNEIRNAVIKEDPQAKNKIMNFLAQRIKYPNLEYDVVICKPDESCFVQDLEDRLSLVNTDVYSYERIISASLDEPNFKPKKVKLFLWRKA